MNKIALLDQTTIDKIAAGEVIERPASIVKELVENAIDAGACAITVEIKEGGISFIRITDNGTGIDKAQVQLAFLRHATSKLRELDDLQMIKSLGFRGEALSSIAAVSQVELITKTQRDFTGTRYIIEGGIEKSLEEVGAPDGTTFLIRNLFFNTPARKKFLKSPTTESSYVGNYMEQLALSHPHISFKYMQNNQVKLHTLGNGNFKEVIYQIYGREITNNLVEVNYQDDTISATGYVGKPNIARGNRSFENYYVNGRYVKSKLITKAIEDGYRAFMMQRKYPFTALSFEVKGDEVDINVHPTKMEVRFDNQDAIYRSVYRMIVDALSEKELIPEVSFDKKPKRDTPPPVTKKQIPEPFEVKRKVADATLAQEKDTKEEATKEKVTYPSTQPKQQTLFEKPEFLKEVATKKHQIIGQLFDTYWLVQTGENLYIIDQHAAHEKVLYERLLKKLKEKKITSQYITPAMIVSVNLEQAAILENYSDIFAEFGFEIEAYGGKEFSVSAVPSNLYGLNEKELFIEMLDGLCDEVKGISSSRISEKLASMACKAAIKGNRQQSRAEIEHLINELLTLDNPYHCPHGRPTIITMSKHELEKKFKRIV